MYVYVQKGIEQPSSLVYYTYTRAITLVRKNRPHDVAGIMILRVCLAPETVNAKYWRQVTRNA